MWIGNVRSWSNLPLVALLGAADRVPIALLFPIILLFCLRRGVYDRALAGGVLLCGASGCWGCC